MPRATRSMSRQRLLDRQYSLLQHLTDPRAFDSACADPGLAGIDAERLRLVGTMSLGKRLGKVRSALPRTFEYLAHIPAVSTAAFAGLYPPHSATRYDNAAQFADYLRDLWRRQPAEPAFLPDLVAVELAIAKVAMADDRHTQDRSAADLGPGFRMREDAELVRCRFDVRPLFDDDVARTPPAERDVRLVITMADGESAPRVFEVGPRIHEFLRSLDGWHRLDRAAAGGSGARAALIGALADKGIVELRT